MQQAPSGGQSDASDPTMNRFYLVVVQYAAKLSSQKISAAVLRLKPGGERLSRARCNLQVAPEEVGCEGGQKGAWLLLVLPLLLVRLLLLLFVVW